MPPINPTITRETLAAAFRAATAAATAVAQADPEDKREADPAPALGLRQRLWPMVEMLRRAQAAQEPVVWGV
jgi:hypothetical protein